MWNYIKKIIIIPTLILSFVSNPIIVLGATFGKITNDPSYTNDSKDYSLINSATPSASGIVKTGEARIWLSSAGSTTVRLVIYSDSGGAPNSLLATSDELTITNTTEQSKVFTFTGSQQINVVQGTPYWIGIFHADPGAININFSADVSTGILIYYNDDTYSDGAESTYTIDGTLANHTLDLFISYDSTEGVSYPLINPNLYRSGLRLDFDGVDEAGKSGDNPTGNTDTVGSLACWVTFDDTLASNNFDIVFSAGGDDTDQATNFGQLSLGRRYASGIDNKLEILQRQDNNATVNRVRGGTTLSAGTYFLGITSSGTAWKLYVNGAEESLTVVAGSNNGNWVDDIGTVGTRHYSVGNSWRDGAWGTGWLNGKIDNCFTTSNELTSSQMLSLYNTGRPIHPCAIITCSNVNVFYKLGEDANGTVTTMHAAIGTPSTDNFTMENMENADIVTTSYY